MRNTFISPPYVVYYKSFKAPFGFSGCVDGGLELLRLRQVPERRDISSAASQKRRKGGEKRKGDWIGGFFASRIGLGVQSKGFIGRHGYWDDVLYGLHFAAAPQRHDWPSSGPGKLPLVFFKMES